MRGFVQLLRYQQQLSNITQVLATCAYLFSIMVIGNNFQGRSVAEMWNMGIYDTPSQGFDDDVYFGHEQTKVLRLCHF
jgi:hypothetical protein